MLFFQTPQKEETAKLPRGFYEELGISRSRSGLRRRHDGANRPQGGDDRARTACHEADGLYLIPHKSRPR